VAKRTQTSNFGTSGRVSHDSTPFYSRKLYKDINMPKPSPKDLMENEVPREFLDKIILGDAREVLKKLPDSCAHLMITSPPYNVGKEYDEDLTLGEYLEMRFVFSEQCGGSRIVCEPCAYCPPLKSFYSVAIPKSPSSLLSSGINIDLQVSTWGR
jgi:hypothetical protein